MTDKEYKPIRRLCVIYERGGNIYGKKVLAMDEASAKKVFFSNRTGYGGCGIRIIRVETFDKRKHAGILV